MEQKPVEDKIVEKIKEWMEYRGINASELARGMGVTPAHVSHLLAGRRHFSVAMLQAATRALGYTLRDIVSDYIQRGPRKDYRDEDYFSGEISDPRLTNEENERVTKKIREVREAYIEIEIRNRIKPKVTESLPSHLSVNDRSSEYNPKRQLKE